ncbi:hypothetical protein ACHAXT_011075 [Thalassiosira profunda]
MDALQGLSAVAAEMLPVPAQADGAAPSATTSGSPQAKASAASPPSSRKRPPAAALQPGPTSVLAEADALAMLEREKARRASLGLPGAGAPLRHGYSHELAATYGLLRDSYLPPLAHTPHLTPGLNGPGLYHDPRALYPPVGALPVPAGTSSGSTAANSSGIGSAGSDELLARAAAGEADARARWLDAARRRAAAQDALVAQRSQQRAMLQGEIRALQDQIYRDRMVQDEMMARRMGMGGLPPVGVPPMGLPPMGMGPLGGYLPPMGPGFADDERFRAAQALDYTRPAPSPRGGPAYGRRASSDGPASKAKKVSRESSESNVASKAAAAAADELESLEIDPKDLPKKEDTLCLPADPTFLTDAQCFLRSSCIEPFVSTEGDGHFRAPGKYAKPSREGQAGFRCIHCKGAPRYLRANQAVCFPSKRENIMESVRNFTRIHLEACPYTPRAIKYRYRSLAQKGAGPKRSPRLVKQYYAQAASEVGLVDTARGMEFFPENRKKYPSEEMQALIKQADVEDEALANGSTLAALYAYDDAEEEEKAAEEDEEVKFGKFASVATDETRRVLEEAKKEATPFVLPDDFPAIADYVYLLFHQLLPCRPTAATVKRRRLDVTQLKVPGLCCKHCVEDEGISGMYFPLNVGSLGDSSFSQTLLVHLSGCAQCPDEVKNALNELQALAREHRSCARRGSKKKFVTKVWGRMEGLAKKDGTPWVTDLAGF